MTDEVLQVSMAIILHAGDARSACQDGLDAISEGDFALAGEKLKEAQKEIVEAHKLQTEAIQAEARGERVEYSLLFSHAQDSVMTINSEIHIAKQLFKIFSAYDTRLRALEDDRANG